MHKHEFKKEVSRYFRVFQKEKVLEFGYQYPQSTRYALDLNELYRASMEAGQFYIENPDRGRSWMKQVIVEFDYPYPLSFDQGVTIRATNFRPTQDTEDLDDCCGEIVSVKGVVSRVFSQHEFEITKRPLVSDPYQEGIEIRSESASDVEAGNVIKTIGVYRCKESRSWIEANTINIADA